MDPYWVKNEKNESGFQEDSISGYFACLTLKSQMEVCSVPGLARWNWQIAHAIENAFCAPKKVFAPAAGSYWRRNNEQGHIFSSRLYA